MTTIGEFTGLRPRKPWHDGKVIHKSRGKAEAAVRALLRRTRRYERGVPFVIRPEALAVYSCREGEFDGGKHYHVGHGKRRQAK